jgi:methyl-branched lipid omega-hydroxylase
LGVPALKLADIDLSDYAFWGRPPAEREAGFALLLAQPQPVFFCEPEAPAAFGPGGAGYYALVKHADVIGASRNHEVFCSSAGATSIIDMPVEFAEYFGSMINMDDPRHARLRRIVSRAFTPRMIKSSRTTCTERPGSSWTTCSIADRAISSPQWPPGFP